MSHNRGEMCRVFLENIVTLTQTYRLRARLTFLSLSDVLIQSDSDFNVYIRVIKVKSS